MKLSIIIPVFKGEDTLVPLFAKIREALSGKFRFEVIFISDNACDDSWEKIEYLHRNNPEIVTGYKLKLNYGQHKTLLFGLKVATGNYIITMDEDMQHDPAYIPSMLVFLTGNDLDIVFGKFPESRKSSLRKFGSNLGRRVAGFLIPDMHRDYSPFRIIRRETAEALKVEKGIIFLDALLGETGSKTGTYPVEHIENARPSSYSPWQLLLLAFSIFIWYSRKARIIYYCVILALLFILSGLFIKTTSLVIVATSVIIASLLSMLLITYLRAKKRKHVLVDETIGEKS